MKSINGKTLALIALAAVLSSFTNYGGEGFEILLNNKILIQQFGSNLNSVQQLKLTQSSANDQLTVKYHRCGQAAKNRTLTIRNSANKILKEWRYPDATADASSSFEMNCKVKDLINLNKGNEMELKLYYYSSQLPNGRLLTNIITAGNTVAIK